MHALLAHARSKQNAFLAFLCELVECESPSNDAAAVARCMDLIADHIADIAAVRKIPGTQGYGPHLICSFNRLNALSNEGQLLFLGHADTVYDLGTLTGGMPFRVYNGRIFGPGVFDMKGGLALVIFALRSLVELDLLARRKVVLQIVSDEEQGSSSSRELTEQNAKQSSAVIVAEPSAGLDGKAKTGRKGVGGFTLNVTGRAAHAGLDFPSGASAILELARQIDRISNFTDLGAGLTVNPGVIRGGTRTNVVAAEASCDFDIRIARTSDWSDLEQRFRSLRPFDKRCTLEVTGGLNRPPLERTKAVAELYERARSLSAEIGPELGETAVGGGSDGNFTAALGIPTLDGMGAVGDGAHTPGEYILENRIPDRMALLALLAQSI